MIKEIYGKKIGMTQIFTDEGNLVAATLLEVEPVYLLEKMSYCEKEKVRVGCFKIEGKKVEKVKKPIKNYFDKLEVTPYRLIREVELAKGAVLSFGSKNNSANSREIGIEIFKEGDIVDVRARTKGKGFSGGMKRHGWHGQPGSHGSTTHRRIGSAGASAYPSRIIKGLRMPGHMGNCFRTTKNLTILKVDKDKNVLFVRGSIPGARGTVVKLKKIDKR